MKKFIKIASLFSLVSATLLIGCESNDNPTSSVYIPQQVNRKVLFEFFSNSNCTPCIEPHRTFLEPLEQTVGVTINDTSVVLLSFQYKYPYIYDSIYRANVPENDARSRYYNVIAAPGAFCDGTTMGNFSFQEWSDQLGREMNTAKYLNITASNNFNSAIDSGTITAYIQTIVQPPTNDNVIHIVITEDSVSYVTAQNHITLYSGVMRDMVTDSTGAGINLSYGQTTNFTINYRIKNTWKADDCFIIVFVQSTLTKKVYGVERIKVN
jgi:Outer membrane protein Omp28